MSFSFRSKNIICFSTADWDSPLPTNKHQLMRRFAARGARVLFIEPLGTRAPKLGSGTDLKRIGRRLARSFAGAVKRAPRLWTLSPLVRPAWGNTAQVAMNRAAFRAQIARVLPHFPDAIAWVYSPYAIHLLDVVEPSRVVYHMVDDLAAVPGADTAAIRDAEARLLACADAVFCTERSLFERARRVTKAAYYAPNVADFRHFSRPAEVSSTMLARLRAMRGPRLLFSGNLAPHKVDFDLLESIAIARPDWSLAIVGPQWEGAAPSGATARLARMPNVLFTGHVPYEELPAYLHAAHALLIPYVRNDATRAVFPLKLFEYLATGRPVVASPLPSLLPFSGAIRIAESAAEWIAAIAAALADTHEMETQRRTLARRHTWERRIREFETILGTGD